MRNLKRALSLALAAAMLVSLMVVGASAADYGDAAQVSQTEAVEVLTGLGVVGGDQNGNFNPTATLTRAEFCVMIANALTGGSFDQSLFSGADTPFTDVQGHWGAGYIAYCYSNGIVAGTSATTFSPDSTLTAAQAAAILLMALGYNQNNEFGANGQFSLNVTRWAQQAGLYDGLAVSANAGISRENTAKLIFNALTNTTPVGYSTLAESYYTIGESALSGKVYSGNQLDPVQDNSDADAERYYTYTLGYTNFGLEQNIGSKSDDFNRPAHKWISDNNSNIGTYADTADFTYTAGVKTADLEKTLKDYTIKSGAKYYTDGDSGNSISDVSDIADQTGKGTLVEIYADNQNNITTVTVINTYLAQAVSDYDAEDETLEIQLVDGNAPSVTDTTLSADDFAITGYQEDDYLLVTIANDTVKSVTPATVMEDSTVTVVKQNSSTKVVSDITIGGTKYDANKNAGTAVLLDGTSTVLKPGDSYDVILDTYGYVIGIKAYSENNDLSDYVFVKKAAMSGFQYVAELVFMDGTTKTVTVSEVGGKDVDSVAGTETQTTNTAGKLYFGNFATYKVDKNGEYELTYVTTTKVTNSIDPAQGAAPINGVTNAGTSKTVFVAKDKAYTGVANAPKVDSGAVYYTLDGKYLEAVYAVNAGKTTTDASEVVYILSDTASVGKDANDVEFYVYDAIVDGKKTTISTNDDASTVTGAGLYTIDSYTDGYADLSAASGGEYVKNTAAVSGTDLYKDGTLTVTGPKAYTVDENAVIVTIDTTDNNAVKSISAGSINNQNSKGFDDITLVLSSDDTDAVVIAIYMVK